MSRSPRRTFLIAAGTLLAGSLTARAQTRARTLRIGVLTGGTPRENFVAIPEELRKLGFEEGRDYTLEYRFWNADTAKIPGFAAELVDTKVDLIVAELSRDILAARRATSTIPIVMVFGIVPVELGLIESLPRPGGNVTGTLLGTPENAVKAFEIIRDVFGRQAAVAVLYQPDYPGLEPFMRQCETGAKLLGLRLTMLPIDGNEDLDAALGRIAKERPSAMYFVPTGAIFRQTDRVLKFSIAERVPAIASSKWPVEQGALLAWEPDLGDIRVRTAAIVAKILRGASPAEIPVEQPATFRLWINRRTANAVGVRIPQSVLVRADRVID